MNPSSWPGYDEKHGGGHGMIMQAAALHYRLTGDEAWLRRARPVLERACAATVLLREVWMERLPRENWCYGLMPPFETGDTTDARCCYYLSHAWYAGLHEVAAVLEESGDTDAKLSEQIQDFRQSLRKAMERTIATTPVVRVRDATYRRYLGWQPYLRTMTTGMQFGYGMDGAHIDCIAGGLRYVPKVFQPQEPIVGELLDVYEDVILLGELASDKPRPTQRASRGPEDGSRDVNSQRQHNIAPIIHILNPPSCLTELTHRAYYRASRERYARVRGRQTDASYHMGFATIWYQWKNMFITPFYWLISPWYHRSGCTTIGEIRI